MQHSHAGSHSRRTGDAGASGQRRLGWTARATGAISATTGTIAGLLPHLLHHIAPIAGTAVLTGAAGSVLFGLLGLVLMLPMLLRLRRWFRSWIAPGIALALFAAMFAVSTIWIGPAIRGDDDTPLSEHEQHDHSRWISRPFWLALPG